MKRRLKPFHYSFILVPLTGVALIVLGNNKWVRRHVDFWGDEERAFCQSQIGYGVGLAFMQYVQDYDDKFPPNQNLGIGKGGWRDEIQQYNSVTPVFECPAAFRNAKGSVIPTSRTDYWFNEHLAGIRLANIQTDKATTLLSGDGEYAQTSNYTLKSLPQEWMTDEYSPAQRHLGGENYLFLDGHVKRFTPNEIQSQLKTTYTFRPQFAKAAQSKTNSEPR